ncbi:hypothetical protein PYW07_011493 [Mythimna separata]|uniref:EGF-like domain-containing protein n=1 Tax=Mythimna separata TaxID=271217 RepID=A0AAD7Y9F8_MYTSE|nr:hypothetical protein PYW07_011493 [Mythimna separata]
MHCTSVLVSIALLIGLVHSFSWDIVVGRTKQLLFYYNGTLTHTEDLPSTYHYNEVQSVTYDPVQNRILFSAKMYYPNISISSFNLSTRKIQILFTRPQGNSRVAYDPVTQLYFWRDDKEIYSYSLNSTSSEQADLRKLLFTLDYYCYDIAVDSCGGYIYWVTDKRIERARLDGSGREVLIDSKVYDRRNLAIDQQTQKIYWTETKYYRVEEVSIKSADFYGNHRTTLYTIRKATFINAFTISADFIYWQIYDQEAIWQLPKNSPRGVAEKIYTVTKELCTLCHRIASNYTILEQVQGRNNCDALQDLNSSNLNPESTASICQKYCFQGNCSISTTGQPTCSCKAGYSGERCDLVNTCHDYCLHGGVCSLNEENKRVCQCTAGYDGERCEVSICKDYCFQGNCNVSAEGMPKCSCKAGFSGDRCEVNMCYNRCSNGGVCSLNEEDEPACECTADYEGERCDIPITRTSDCPDNATQQVIRDLRSVVRLIIQELIRILQFFSHKLDEYEAQDLIMQ